MACYDRSKIQRQGRTSRFVVFLRTWFIGSAILWVAFTGIKNVDPASNGEPADIYTCLVGTLFLLLGYGAWVWIGSLFVHWIINRNDPWYHYYRSRGWSPFWDTLPWPFNPDTEATRKMGLREPDYKALGVQTPPASWVGQCPVCGARVASQICWNCNYAADGDSSAYYQRFGQAPDAPPPANYRSNQPRDVPPEQHVTDRSPPLQDGPDFPFSQD